MSAAKDFIDKFSEVQPLPHVITTLTGILQIAEYITARLEHTTLQGIDVVISTPLIEHMQDNIDEYTILIEDLLDETIKAQAFYG